jgi:hypothetical protein
MKLINGNPLKKISTVESAPLGYTIIHALVIAAAGAAAAWVAGQAVDHAMGMEEITFDYNDRITDDSDDTPVAE